MEPIIEAISLNKSYLSQNANIVSIKELLNRLVLFSKNELIKSHEVIQNLSFRIYPGDCVAIQGNNGSGKSTLLAILANITYPSSGKVIIRGKVSTLLEISVGFSSEMTGRENIFLRGTALGFSINEVIEKLDEIIDFAEIRDFLDIPIKRFSSGMFMRLAFAISVTLVNDILLIDEVLAVGDYRFKEKCISRLKDLMSSGKVILCVSHEKGFIEQISNKVIRI